MKVNWSKQLIKNLHIFCTELDAPRIEGILAAANLTDARSILSTDFTGMITRFSPPKTGMSMGDVLYIVELQVMQRCEQMDRIAKKALDSQVALDKKQKELEALIASIGIKHGRS
jgi:hypothetical protein